ncbi:MAG: acyltransferase family protein [Lachnospiraceae bacterium]|nr:acyltransferase family protein [Lachnospiraceae bacterium]
MKTFFKASISSFITMCVILVLAIILTGNSQNEEKTSMGNVFTDSKGSTIYLEPAHLSFVIKSESKKYFADTKARGAATYLKANGITFAAELLEDIDEMEIYIAPFSLNDVGSIEEDYLDFLENRMKTEGEYTLLGAQGLETVELQENVFYHIYYSSSAKSNNEYQFGSAYLMNVDDQCIVFHFIRYMDKSPVFANGSREMDPVAERIMGSVTYGDATGGRKLEEGFLSNLLTFSFSLWIFLIPIFYFLTRNVSVVTESGEWQDDLLGRDRSRAVLGLFAVLIVLHHLVQHVGAANAGVLSFMEDGGVLFVGAYFFYSGFGLFYSYKNKKDYLKGFIKKRLPVVLIPFYVNTLVYVLCNILVDKKPLQIETILQLLGIHLINDHMWYIAEIVILYLAFWLFFRWIKNEKVAMIAMTIFVLAMMNGSLFLGHGNHWFQGEWWYNTTFLFVLGMLVARKKETFLRFIKRHYGKVLIATILVFIGLSKGNAYMLETRGYWTSSTIDKYLTLAVQLPLVISFVALTAWISMKIKCDNAVVRFFGKISLELYLIHNLFIQHFSFVRGKGVYFFLVYVAAILAAALLHRVDTMLICLFQKTPLPEKHKLWPEVKALLAGWKKQILFSLHGIRHNPKRFIKTTLREIISLVWALVTLAPICLLVINATKSRIIGVPLWLPGKNFLNNLHNINSSFSGPGGSIVSGIVNSTIVATATSLLSTYLGSMTAYAFERYKFKGKKQLWVVMIGCLMIPQSVAYVGIYKVVVRLGLLNHLSVLILLGLANPAAVYFIRMYLKNINLVEIGEAARIDGAKEFSIFHRIVIPIIKPAFALQVTFSFVSAWNNGFAQDLFLMGWKKKTIASYVSLFAGSASFSPEEYALMFVATLPPLIVYILCSKSIVSSITLGAVKE